MSRQSAGCVETEAYKYVCQLAKDMRRRRENVEEAMLWLHLRTGTLNEREIGTWKSQTLAV